MKVETIKIFCDVCKKEIIEKRWEDKPQRMHIEVFCGCQNPIGYLPEKPGFQGATLQFEHVCKYCSNIIAQDIYDSISKIRNN